MDTSWRDSIREVVDGMPTDSFTLVDVYERAHGVIAAHPDNKTPDSIIRRVLQELRDEGYVSFVSPGRYSKNRSGTSSRGDSPAARRSRVALFSQSDEQAIREDIVEWLDNEVGSGQGEVSRDALARYSYHGDNIPLIDRTRGIRNPARFNSTLSVMTSTSKTAYSVGVDEKGLVRYSYQAADAGDNVKLRNAHRTGAPIIYLVGTRPNYFIPHFPVYVHTDDPVERNVYLDLSQTLRLFADPVELGVDDRRYVAREVKQRLHQPLFRAKVLRAYAQSCAICRLDVPELLDAAHITEDSEVDGLPAVTNGVALCALHHRAFDRHLIGITSDYHLRVQASLRLRETSISSVRELTNLEGRKLHLPRRRQNWPDCDALSRRLVAFERQ